MNRPSITALALAASSAITSLAAGQETPAGSRPPPPAAAGVPHAEAATPAVAPGEPAVGPADAPTPAAAPAAAVAPLAAAGPATAPTAVAKTTGAPAAAKGGQTGSGALAALVPGSGSPFAGSTVTLRNTATAISLDKAHEPTYNPYYALQLTLAPNVILPKGLYARASAFVTRELTQEDDTTYRGESVWSDTNATLGWRALRVPSLGAMLNLEALFTLPTSKASQARTLTLGTGLGATLIVSAGDFYFLGISRATYNWHRYTTGQTETPWLPGCQGTATGCDPYIGNGVRNPEWRLLNLLGGGWSPAAWLGLNAQFAVIDNVLYGATDQRTPAGVAVPVSATNSNLRGAFYYGLSAELRVHKALIVLLGVDTFNPQLQPDSTYRQAVFNRFSTLYVDLQVAPDKLLAL
ncbi:MAG: hypothetical protein FJ100_10445 [Deltaproteobacteria bacterium]|nr:hypothetical protein [Deltaproteobacteria bacterium]